MPKSLHIEIDSHYSKKAIGTSAYPVSDQIEDLVEDDAYVDEYVVDNVHDEVRGLLQNLIQKLAAKTSTTTVAPAARLHDISDIAEYEFDSSYDDFRGSWIKKKLAAKTSTTTEAAAAA